jgi:Nickel responsive protein SCO4226-like
VPRYVIERAMSAMPNEDLDTIGRRSATVADAMDGVVWVKSFISEAEGKIYCVYDAPSPEAIREHARRVGIPANTISEIGLEISPAMFR